MKRKFIDWNPSSNSIKLLNIINSILYKYANEGYTLTLRQLYYQLVANDFIENKIEEYKRIGNVVSKGRLAGRIDWNMIEDRLRTPESNQHWNNPSEIIKTAVNSYYLSRWDKQNYYIEVWCEKDAVSNIIQPVCSKWDVTFMANRGYSSQSAMYEAYQRFDFHSSCKYLAICYFGDHDPSGIDMIRDIKDRLYTFFNDEIVNINKIALTIDQIKQYNPPENPAKITDTRYEKYANEYGESSWELDAIEPSILSSMVEDAIFEYLDISSFEEIEKKEKKEKDKILKLLEYI